MLFALVFQGVAQKTAQYTADNHLYNEALELYEKEKFSAAQNYFKQTIEGIENPFDETRVNAEYYFASCALALFNRDAVYYLNEFAANHPESKWIERVNFKLGNYYYRKKKSEEVIAYFTQVNEFSLNATEQIEYRFKLGYSYMQIGNAKNALTHLYPIIDVESEYQAAANYYYAHINYEAKNYQIALERFTKIKDERSFSKVIPYYIAQIYFIQNRYDELLAYALPLLENEDTDRAGEIARMIGETYCNKRDFKTALPYLKAYMQSGEPKQINDYYQYGNALYNTGDYLNAAKNLSQVANDESEMGQSAQYQLADCYLKMGNKIYARNAFQAAAKLDYNTHLKEDAFFNYAKLAYELSYNPYHEAIIAFKEYLKEFPNTERSDEANEFLLYVFLNTKNYQAALEAMDLIQNKDFKLQNAYQYIAFNRAVELFLAKEFDASYDMFEKVNEYPIDKKLTAESNYWRAEIKYIAGRYGEALALYKRFRAAAGAYSSGFYSLSDYNIAYANFKLENFGDAATHYRKFIQSRTAKNDAKRTADAYLRLADCYFVVKQYDLSVEYYDKAAAYGKVEPDYALYQSALAKGYLNREEDKINSLVSLRQNYPNSKYAIDAAYELGEAYFKNEENAKALEALNQVVVAYPNSQYARKSMLLVGLIQYRNKEYDKAIGTFKQIARDYPNYNDAREAISRAEDIYVELGRVDEYNEWVQSLSFYDVSKTALDSVNYRSAENLYTNNNCERAIPAFNAYLNKFENAIFGTNARFYLAECLYKAKEYGKALENYDVIAKGSVNKFTEPALVSASYIAYQAGDFPLALSYYTRLEDVAEFKSNILEAQIGQMRCYNKMNNNSSVITFADKVLSNTNTPDRIRIEAWAAKGRSLMSLSEFETARGVFDTLAASTQAIEGAEARYNLAYILFLEAKYKEAEDAIFEMVNIKPAYDYWLAKSFVLLGDVYIKMEDFFQAKATLQSVVENHDGEELTNLAKAKIAEIEQLETAKEQVAPEASEIQIGNNTEEYEELFEEDSLQTQPKPMELDSLPAMETEMEEAPVDTLQTNPVELPRDTVPIPNTPSDTLNPENVQPKSEEE